MGRKRKLSVPAAEFEARLARAAGQHDPECVCNSHDEPDTAIPVESKRPTSVKLTMVLTPFNTWACYIDGTLAEWGGDQMTASQLLRVLDGRAVEAAVTISVPQLPDSGEFPRQLSGFDLSAAETV